MLTTCRWSSLIIRDHTVESARRTRYVFFAVNRWETFARRFDNEQQKHCSRHVSIDWTLVKIVSSSRQMVQTFYDIYFYSPSKFYFLLFKLLKILTELKITYFRLAVSTRYAQFTVCHRCKMMNVFTGGKKENSLYTQLKSLCVNVVTKRTQNVYRWTLDLFSWEQTANLRKEIAEGCTYR